MAWDYRCSGCKLVFSVGFYVYRRDVSSGYGAATLAVCTSCGAQHRVEHARRDSRDEPFDFFDVVVERVPDGAHDAVATIVHQCAGFSEARTAAFLKDLKGGPRAVEYALPEEKAIEAAEQYRLAGAVVWVQAMRRPAPDPNPVPPCSDRLLCEGRQVGISGERTGVTGAFRLAEQGCGDCERTGSLVSDPAEVPSVCPRCGAPIEAPRVWL
jgi:hypothetical protein